MSAAEKRGPAADADGAGGGCDEDEDEAGAEGGGGGGRVVGVVQAAAVFGFGLGLALHAEYLTEGAGDSRRLEPDLAVVGAVDVADKHVNAGVVAARCHVEHVVEGPGTGQEGEEAPERPASERGTAYALILPRT